MSFCSQALDHVLLRQNQQKCRGPACSGSCHPLKAKVADVDTITVGNTVSLNVLYIKCWVILLLESVLPWQEGVPEA